MLQYAFIYTYPLLVLAQGPLPLEFHQLLNEANVFLSDSKILLNSATVRCLLEKIGTCLDNQRAHTEYRVAVATGQRDLVTRQQ
jgi:hypothetical protein